MQPLLLEQRNAYVVRSSQARVAPKGPRAFLFLCPAGGIGIRACLRNMIFRVRIPGGVPDFFMEAVCFHCSFTTWMWQSKRPRRA